MRQLNSFVLFTVALFSACSSSKPTRYEDRGVKATLPHFGTSVEVSVQDHPTTAYGMARPQHATTVRCGAAVAEIRYFRDEDWKLDGPQHANTLDRAIAVARTTGVVLSSSVTTVDVDGWAGRRLIIESSENDGVHREWMQLILTSTGVYALSFSALKSDFVEEDAKAFMDSVHFIEHSRPAG